MKNIIIELPSAMKSFSEDEKRLFLSQLEKALNLDEPISSMWQGNSEYLLSVAEDELYCRLMAVEEENMACLFAALGLQDEEINKSFEESFIKYEDTLEKAKSSGRTKVSDMIAQARLKAKDFLKYIQGGNPWTKGKLAELEKVLKHAIVDYKKVAEEFATRAAFLAKIRNKEDNEALDTLGALVENFPKTITEARHEKVVLTLKQKQKAEAMGQRVEIMPLQPQEVRTAQCAALRTAEKIQEISERHRAGVKQTVLQAVNGRWSSQELAQALFDKYSEENRDWRRVAITELAMATNDAYLAGLEEGDTVWVAPVEGSCRYCKQYLEGKTFTVTNDTNKMGKDHIQEMTYVWSGKSNFGRTVATYIPCIPLHPNCRHRWHKLSKFYKVVDGKPVLKTSAEMIQEELKRRGLPPDTHLKA